jgi:hypothetical protein
MSDDFIFINGINYWLRAEFDDLNFCARIRVCKNTMRKLNWILEKCLTSASDTCCVVSESSSIPCGPFYTELVCAHFDDDVWQRQQ